jgi:hypothetical protein
MNSTNSIVTQEFQQVHGIISLHRLRALQTVNNENLLTAWEVGAYVSNLCNRELRKKRKSSNQWLDD